MSWITSRAAQDTAPATCLPTAMYIRACNFRCRAATCANRSSSIFGNILRSSRKSGRYERATCRCARRARTPADAADALASHTWKVTCGVPRRRTVRNRSQKPGFRAPICFLRRQGRALNRISGHHRVTRTRGAQTPAGFEHSEVWPGSAHRLRAWCPPWSAAL